MFRDVPVFRVPVFLEILHAVFSADSRVWKKESMSEEMEDLNEKVILKCIYGVKDWAMYILKCLKRIHSSES